jgi:hypothetical protein
MHPDLEEEQLDHITKSVLEFFLKKDRIMKKEYFAHETAVIDRL